jgi:uncharacterized protein YkwD
MVNQILSSLHINWIDIIFLGVLLYCLLINSGFINGIIEIGGLLFSSLISFKLYSLLGGFLQNNFSLSRGVAMAAGYIILWLVSEGIFFLLIQILIRHIPKKIFASRINYFLGVIPALFQGGLFFMFIVTALIALPVRGDLKKEVLSSQSGPYFITLSRQFESSIRFVFNDAISESLNFITIKPKSDERIDLGFTVPQKNLTVDKTSEDQMFELVNQERAKLHIPVLEKDTQLTLAAREYAKTMFINGFFSHESLVDHTTPAQRLDNKSIPYGVMGENLAFAPDVLIAHTGLMNSEGHRKNILSPDFKKVGIGVIDGGIYGRMFVQEFTD